MSIMGSIIVPHPPLILPQIGGGQERAIQKTIEGYREAVRQLARWKPETVVILSPHTAMYQDYFHISPGTEAEGDFGPYLAPEVSVKTTYDLEFTEALEEYADRHGMMAGTYGEQDSSLDHATMIPLLFLNEVVRNYQTVRVGLSGFSFLHHYQLGIGIQQTADLLNRRVAVIASGDLSHRLLDKGPYDFAPEGPLYDKQIIAAMAEADFGAMLTMEEAFCEKAGECGHRAFVIMAGTLDGKTVDHQLLSYEGPFGVGYATAVYQVTGASEERRFEDRYRQVQRMKWEQKKTKEDPYVQLARYSLEYYVNNHKEAPLPEKLPDDLGSRRAGAFVSLKMDGQLRGCIGTIEAVQANLALEILHNAVSAGMEDPRFPPVQKSELMELVYSVDVLGEAEEASIEELDASEFGVIVTCGRRRGLLLPNLEGVDSVQQQLAIALHKAGIEESEPYRIERFRVVRHR